MVHLLPVLREALSNVARHAHATSVDVTIEVGAQVVMSVRDDGVGIPEDGGKGGNGIRNMIERAVRLDGECDVRSRSEGGAIVEWRVPTVGITSSTAPEPSRPAAATDT
jgi:signal transduction histidine kinase